MFQSIVNLEEEYYHEGYALGVEDGARSGRIEGRVFGLEKGFEKFLEMGRLGGKAAIWSARLPTSDATAAASNVDTKIPVLRGSERLTRRVNRLSTLTDTEDLSTANTEEAVSEFDERLKDARTKATLIGKMVNESHSVLVRAGAARQIVTDHDEQERPHTSSRTLKVSQNNRGKSRSNEMEDFAGLNELHG